MNVEKITRNGSLGEVKIFNSVLSMRLGSPVKDLCVYAISASRRLFKDEPIEVMAMTANEGDLKVGEMKEMLMAILKFPGNRLATFTASFHSLGPSYYEVIGTEGKVRMDAAEGLAKKHSRNLKSPADLKIMQAFYESAKTGEKVTLQKKEVPTSLAKRAVKTACGQPPRGASSYSEQSARVG